MIEFYLNIKQKINKLTFLIFFKNSFNSFGSKSTLCFPFKINGAKYISIGSKVYINENAWLLAQNVHQNTPILKIGNNSYVGRNSHIVSVQNVTIGQNVLIADRVYISDNLHEYQDIDIPIKSQPIIFKNKTYIGDNSWLGENVCVIGASIGKHCVIGANSLVINDIPDYSVAVGSPAKVIKKYNFQTSKWEKV